MATSWSGRELARSNSTCSTGEYSPVEQVEFERASSRPDQLVAIRYERHETLVAMGVLPRWRPAWHDPDPFPGALGFVPDP